MESIMNRLISRIFFMATLLSLFNIASANDSLLGIEVSPDNIEEEQSSMDTGDNRNMAVEHGDILGIEASSPSMGQPMQMERELVDITLPVRGMSKKMVESEFGQPINIRAAVGKPPISSWVYDEFTVYFEFKWVLHSVLNK